MKYFLIFAILVSPVFSQWTLLHKKIPLVEDDVIRLNVVAGQSNAVGSSADWSAFTLPASASNIRFELSSVSNGAGGGNPTSYPSLDFQPLVNFTNRWLGPEAGFSDALISAFPDRDLAVFKSSIGGTSLFIHWDHNPPAPLELTRNTVEGLAAYKTSLENSTGKTVVLESVFWWQGESDANNDRAFIWEDKMVETIQFWRDTLGAPNLKFYLGRLPDYQSAIYVNHQFMRDAVENIAANDPNAEWIDLDGLNSNDTVHVDQAGQIIVGQRWFAQYRVDFP